MTNIESIAESIYNKLKGLKFNFKSYEDVKETVETFNGIYGEIMRKLSQAKKEEKDRILVQISAILEEYKELRIKPRLIEVDEIIEKISKLNKKLKNLI